MSFENDSPQWCLLSKLTVSCGSFLKYSHVLIKGMFCVSILFLFFYSVILVFLAAS